MSASPDLPADPARPSAEDAKLLTLARAARARTGGAEGAAVRDEIGRTYAAATVSLPSLSLTAVQAVVAAAVSSGADHVEAVAVVSEAHRLSEEDERLLADLAVTTVLLAGSDGVSHRLPSGP